MNFRPTKFIARFMIVTFMLGWFVWASSSHREAKLFEEHHQWLASQQKTWAQQDARQAYVVLQQGWENEKAHHEELVKALGGSIAAATKDATLDIRRMLTQAASACAPTGTIVSVTVDRFTEFEVAFVLTEPLSISRLAMISKPLLDLGTPYLHSLRFIQGNGILAQLDWSAIESVTNWSKATTVTVEHLLLAGATPPPPNTVTFAPKTEPTSEDLNPDQKKIRAAQTAFKQLFSEHSKVLADLVGDLDHSSRLDGLQSRSQLQERIQWLDDLESFISIERRFFLNQSAEMDRLWREQGLDALLVTIMKRNMHDNLTAETPLITNVFDAVSAYRGSNRDFLASLAARWGEWEAVPATQQIRFTSSAAKDAYTLGSNKTLRSAEAVQRAFRAWTTYQKSN